MAKTNKVAFWPCGGDTKLGCGRECWEGVPRLKRVKRQKVVFCSKCAKEVKK